MSNSVRSAQVLIREAQLISGSNDFVYNFYYQKSLSSEVINEDDIDSDTELKLLSKNDNFLDLTLAEYCLCSSTILYIFTKALTQNNMPLILACLSTKNLAKTRYGKGLPFYLFDSTENKLKNWLANASTEELFLLFKNEAISDGFLVQFLDSEKEFWNCIDDEKKIICIDSLRRNKRITKRYEGDIDGYAEYKYGLVFNSIWNLAKITPVTNDWGWCLGNLLDVVIDDRYDFDSLEVAKRWHTDDDDSVVNNKKLSLNGCELLRCSLYKNIVKDIVGKDDSNSIHFENSDIAYRACAYQNLEFLTSDDIRNGYKKDGLVAINHFEQNIHIWKESILRSAFKRVCWDADKEYNSDHLDCVNSFNRRQAHFESIHPEWFVEKIDDEYEDEDDKVLTIGLAREIVRELKYDIVKSISSIKTSYGWIFYVVAVLLLILLFK
jgi:hypothetical protein